MLYEPWTTLSYWMANFNNVTRTHISVKCRTCHYVNHRITLVNLKKTQPGCFCSKTVKWNDPSSKRALDDIVAQSRFRWKDCAMDDLWWKENITGESSIMPVVCNVCALETTTTITNFRKRNGQSVGCRCSQEVATIDSLAKRASLQGSSIVSVGDNFNSDSTVMVSCNACKFVAPSTFSRLKHTKPSCICSGRVLWSNVQMRPVFVEIVQSTRFDVPAFAESDAAWEKKSPCGEDHIELQCRLCNHVSEGLMHKFLHCRTLPCKCCRFQTEAMFLAALSDIIDKCTGLRFAPHAFVKYASGGYGFVDAIVHSGTNPIVAFELDGDQHFRSVDPASPQSFIIQQRRDREKEAYCISAGLPLVRFVQSEMFHNKIDWKKLLNDAVDQAAATALPATMYHSISNNRYVCVCGGTGVCAWCGRV